MKKRECKPEACLVCGKIFRSRTQLFAHIAEEGHEADDSEEAESAGAASPRQPRNQHGSIVRVKLLYQMRR